MGLADDDEIPAAGAGLAEKRSSGGAAGEELRHRDVLGNQVDGSLQIALGPLERLPLQLAAAHRKNDGTPCGERRRRGSAAQQAQTPMPRLNELDRPRKCLLGRGAVVDANQDPVEHRKLLFP